MAESGVDLSVVVLSLVILEVDELIGVPLRAVMPKGQGVVLLNDRRVAEPLGKGRFFFVIDRNFSRVWLIWPLMRRSPPSTLLPMTVTTHQLIAILINTRILLPILLVPLLTSIFHSSLSHSIFTAAHLSSFTPTKLSVHYADTAY